MGIDLSMCGRKPNQDRRRSVLPLVFAELPLASQEPDWIVDLGTEAKIKVATRLLRF